MPLTARVIAAALVSAAALEQPAAGWHAGQSFADRASLVAGVARESASIVEELRDAAGDRWPPPPRRR